MAAGPGNIEIIGDPAESLFELDDPLAQRPAHLGKPFAEQEDGDAHDDDHFHRTKIKHVICSSSAVPGETRFKPTTISLRSRSN